MKRPLLLLGFAVALAAHADTVLIEAESFDDWGGWVNDTQFMDQMGSPYLLAHGMGKPVVDAKTKFVVAGGRYNVWVRTKNWTSFWHPDIGAGRRTARTRLRFTISMALTDVATRSCFPRMT